MKKVIIPIPVQDFDPTESGVPWKIMKQNKINVTFATPLGKPGLADDRMLTGSGLGIWKNLLKADANGLKAYQEMAQSSEFQNPIAWNDIHFSHFDAILLPGGHAPGMKEYLESQSLQQRIADFFSSDKLVGAICHGVLLAARSRNAKGQSVLHDHKVTALLKNQEMTAWALTCLWLKNYYRTYNESVQAEVTRNLSSPKNFVTGPLSMTRDSMDHLEKGFVVESRNLISARWPGDAHLFGTAITKRLLEKT